MSAPVAAEGLTDDRIMALYQETEPKNRDPLAGLSHEWIQAFARAAIAASASASHVPEGFVVAPHYRGYAALGTGQYVLNHSAVGAEPEFVISVATEAEKAGREVGDERDNAPDALLQPDAMAVRIAFANVAGLDAMENQLRKLRMDHFPVSVDAIADENAKGYRPPFCDGGGCLSNCCEDGCAADRELAEMRLTGAKP